jgi:demethylmenaquinone methyltransferase/2-methoxy-6-polyprenyl-1,4-benzoquinol methylase
MGPSLASPDKATIRNFFEGIASHYDRLNTLLSFRLDQSWRKRSVRLILEGGGPGGGPETILDLGVGTGKFLEEFLRERRWKKAAGIDFAGEMLRRGRARLPVDCDLIQADIHDLPFADGSFDLVVSSFTLRSVKNRPHFFSEVRRILQPEGEAAFLCLTRPTSFWMRLLYAPYLKLYLPWIGGAVSSDRKAYRFLSDSIQSFPSPPEIQAELEGAGFRRVSIHPFTFGLSTLIRSFR